MRSIPAFSKKSDSGPTVGGNSFNKQRSGFTDNVKTTKVSNPPAAKGLAGFKKIPLSKNVSQPAHPGFKPRSSSGTGKSVPAFSKKKI